MKKLKRILMVLVTLFSLYYYLPIQEVHATSGVETKLNSLRTKFPDGKYWNHYGTANNPDGYTSQPCQTHNGNGNPDCNTFDKGLQCVGFARKIFYDIFGIYASQQTKRYDISNVQVGDFVSIKNSTHAGVILSKSGNNIRLVECNFQGMGSKYNCWIKWGYVNYNISDITYFIHASNYDTINASVVKPGTPTLNVKAGNSITNTTFNWNSTSNTHHYDLRIYNSSGTVILYKNNLTSTAFSYSLPAGNYSASIASVGTSNDNYTFSQRVSFTVKVQPSKPILRVVPGTSGYKTILKWDSTSNTDYYDVRIYNASTKKIYKSKGQLKNTSYSILLPEGKYYANVASVTNNGDAYTFSSDVYFDVEKNPEKNVDGWYYTNQLPSYVTSDKYTIQYNHSYEKVQKTSPGSDWKNAGLVKSQYENSGATYWSKTELPTSNTRVLIGYEYYHYCGGSTGVYANYEMSGNYTHEDRITNVNAVTIESSGPDSDNANYKYYKLKWNNGGYAYCSSGTTCDGSYGSHGNRSCIWYRNSQYQNKVLVNYYKYTKTSGWKSKKDSSATSIKYRFKEKDSVIAKDYKGTYDGKSHTISLNGIKAGSTVKYRTSTKNVWSTKKPTRTKVGTTTVYYQITNSNNKTISGSKKIVINKRNVSTLTYSNISNQKYTGKQIKPNIVVKYRSKKLKKGTDYSISYGSNKTIGKGTIKITGKGNYTGSKTISFNIVSKTSTPSIRYNTHVQDIGWQSYVKNGATAGTSGQSLRLEGIHVSLDNVSYSGSVQYRTHIQNIGWQGWKSNGAMSGTSGKSLRLEAIQIKLTGNVAKKYDVYYRVHCQNFGWMGWAKNGQSAGSAGYSYRLEGIQIKLVKKGDNAPGSTKNRYISK